MTITDENLTTALRSIAADRPDHVYTNPNGQSGSDCYYVHYNPEDNTAEPGCIVGQALHALGISLSTLARHEDEPAHVILNNLAPTLGPGARSFASAVQRWQDKGMTWGESIQRADADVF